MPHDRSTSYGSWLHCWRLLGIGNAGVWERRAQSRNDEAGIDDFPSESSIRREESHGAPVRSHRERRGIQRYQRYLEGCLRKTIWPGGASSPRLPTSDCDNTSRPTPTTHRMGETRPASRRARFEGRAPFYGLQARMQGRRIHPPPQHTGTIIVYIILP